MHQCFLRFLRFLCFACPILALCAVAQVVHATPSRCPSTQTASIVNSVTTGRLALDGTSSTCGTTKTFPGANQASTVHYLTFPYLNRTNADACVTATLTATQGELETAAYLTTFTATNPAAAYLGDPGGSASALTGATTATQTYSFNVPKLAQFVIMVQETTLGAGGTFSLSVANCGQVVVTGTSPDFGALAGGEAVKVTGSGFLPGATVTLGGTPLTAVTVNGDGSISGASGPHVAGAVDVLVTNSDGTQATLAGGYSYLAQAPSSVQITSSLSPSVYGQWFTITAQVSGSNPPATFDGTVTLQDGGTTITNPVAVAQAGVATFSVDSTLAVGTHTLTAVYNGGTAFAASTSPAITQVITVAGTQMALSASSTPATFGLPVTFSVTLTAIAPGFGSPTGTVTFSGGSASPQTATLNSIGEATWTTSDISVGTSTINAAYGGDGNFGASSATVTGEIVQGTSTLLLNSSAPNGAVYGSPITFSVLLDADGVVPTGAVTFTVDGAATSVPVSSTGDAALTTSTLSSGAHWVTATYAGDTGDIGATASLTQMVTTASTVTSVASSLNPATVTDPVVLTVTVTAPGGGRRRGRCN